MKIQKAAGQIDHCMDSIYVFMHTLEKRQQNDCNRG